MRLEYGIVRAYDATTHRADVVLVGAMGGVTRSVAVAHQVGAELVVEDAVCAVGFFAAGEAGVLLCTFDGAPDPWVTSALIKDGEVAPADLSFSPATPDYDLLSSTTQQSLTTTPTVYQTLTKSVTVPSGKTYNVLVAVSVESDCTSYVNPSNAVMCAYRGANQLGAPQAFTHRTATQRSSCSTVVSYQTGSTVTFSVKVWKSGGSTLVVRRGNMTVLYWEATV